MTQEMKWKVERIVTQGEDGNQGATRELVAQFKKKKDAERFVEAQTDTNGWVSYRVYGIRKLVIELKTDAEVPLWELQRDLETEINCASYFYFTDEMKIREVECEDDEA